MKRLEHLILALLVLSCPVLAATEQIPVTKTYGGIIDISAPLTEEPPSLNDEKFEPLLVIRTQQDYADLLRRIPTKGISQGSPAPKNDDPLLQKPQIDFTNMMLVVVVRASMDAPEILNIGWWRREIRATAVTLARVRPCKRTNNLQSLPPGL